MDIVIHKYKGENYFNSNTLFLDKLIFNEIYNEGFPLFNYETEDVSGIAIYRGGEFDLTISLLQQNISANGKSIRDFFLDDIRDYLFMVTVFCGQQKFTGITTSSQLTGDYTVVKNKNELRIICKDIMQEWRDKCKTVAMGTLSIGNNERLTFEQYIPRHFSGVTGSKVLIGTPTNKTYLQRLQPYTGTGGYPPSEAVFLGAHYNFIEDKFNISRWETWKEFIKGIGCNFKMQVNGNSIHELQNEPEFEFEIFFIDDLENETPSEIQIIEDKEYTTVKKLKWLYSKYRSLVLSGVDYTSGIVFNKNTSFYSDADNANNQLYPALLLTMDNKLLSYNDGNHGENNLGRDVDFLEIDLKQYRYSFNPNVPIGKLYPLDEADGGGMAYAQCMVTVTANVPPPTSNIDFYNHLPINRYAIKNYKRYINGLEKAKEYKIVYNEQTNLRLWKTIKVNDFGVDELYYISAIKNIDFNNETADIECIKIKNL